MDDRECAEAEEIHFQQSEMLAGDGGELCRRLVAGAFGDGGDFRDGHIADDDACRVDGHVAVQPFKDFCKFPQLLVFRVVINELFDFVAAVVGFGEGHFGICWNEFAEAVALFEGHSKRACDVFDDGLGFQRAEGADLHDVGGAVLFADVFDDDVTAAFAQVDVEIRRTDALWVQKTFEQKTVADRIDVCDVHQVGDDGASARTAARTERHADFVTIVQEVPHDQKIADEFRLLDDADFIVHTVDNDLLFGCELLCLRVEAVPFGDALFADFAEVLFSIFSVRCWIFRIMVGGRFVIDGWQMDAAAFGDFDGVGHGFWEFGKECCHFVGVLEPESIAVKAHTIRVFHGFLRTDAEEDLMGFFVFLKQVMGVICDDKRDAFPLGDFD